MNYTRTESEEAARSPSPETLTPTEHNPICIIPARMGSKRVYQKNLQEIESNVTLIEQAVECCGCYDFAISTDNPDLVPGSLRSHCITRPAELCTDTADISEAIAHSLKMLASNSDGSRYNTVVVLQPAVVARSKEILDDMLIKYRDTSCEGAVTVIKTHPWIWSAKSNSTDGYNSWFPGPYPRSQDSLNHFIEINSIQIASLGTAMSGKRWALPIMLYELPEWASVFDIDTPQDLDEAKRLYQWAKPYLKSWTGDTHVFKSINGVNS